MKRLALLLPLLALATAPASAEDPATNAPSAFRATILGDRPAGPYLVSNRVARLRDTFGLSSPSGLRSAFDARSAPEGAVAERSFREEADGRVSIRRERFLVPFSELPAEHEFSDGFRVRLEPADGPAAPPPAEADDSVFVEWHASLTGPAESPPEGVSPAVYLARRQMDPFGPPDGFEFSLGYRNHPALPEGTNVVWAGWLRSEQGAGFIDQSWPVRLNGQRLEIGHTVFWNDYRGGDLFLFEIRSLPLNRLRLFPEVRMTGCLLAISTDGSRPAVLDSDLPEEFRETAAVADDPAVVRELLKDIEDIQRSGADGPRAESVSTDSPLASALANGDWLPLVVESVSIDVTAPRELRKNWVVSFASGIKARIHSPVKTFGVSADELPGKRFNVRFADCAAATNALHGTVYAGELEVHPSQNPDIPPTNAPAAVPPFRLPGVRVGMTWDEFAAVRTNATLSAGKDAPRVQAGEPKESACEVLEGDFPFAVYSFSGDADGNALEEIVFFAKGGIDPEATIRAAVDCLGEPDVGKTVACQGTIVDVLVWRDGRTLSVLLASVASEFGDEDDPSAGTEFRVCLDSERFRERFGVLDPSVRGIRSNPYPYLPKLPTTGEVVQYVHCRRGEPWEDIDRKTGEAVLSLVSDYRGYRRVNSKEPSFQRAWREGFVDLLLRGNDDVRHLTFSSDGAWLDVGDGYYYLAVPEEKRPELLKLLEPFERQTTSADAPAASESHAESTEHGPDAEKWKRIVLPIVDFRQSRVVDVVEFLEDLARNHDDFVAAARGQGVTFVLDVPADAVDSLPLVTCKMKSVSVYSAIDTIAEMSGLEWSVDGDVIRLTLAPGRPAADETHAEAEDGVDGGCFGAAPSAEN